MISGLYEWELGLGPVCAYVAHHTLLYTDNYFTEYHRSRPHNTWSMFVPIILGSDKTTVSVAMGQQAYHPVYLSIGNVHNRIRRAHKDALVLIGFLPIPKGNIHLLMFFRLHSFITTGTQEDARDGNFHNFRRCLFHGCLTAINETLKPYMQQWDLVRCSDHHFCQAIYGLGPYIANYPEQSLAAGMVYGWCVTFVCPS